MSKKKILLIDDDKFLIDMYSLKFSQADFEVSAALGAEDALKKLREGFQPDAILLDVVMPGMSGIELLRTIREEKLDRGATVVVLSNQGQQNDIDEAKAVGIDGYIVKASTIPSEVLEQVREIMEHKNR
ncbi:response regulator [Candidatus Parcubacteria bacterium]|nr:response regulator [Candidatus Parcubacteria bacterium]